ncbi:glycosyltransferase family 2 protein [Rudaea sp.]|uniref:glycosyltransferase family 2 protein n=1 Tax=Rudaea sp. TaxID=2136325 RepID=UPI00322055EE
MIVCVFWSSLALVGYAYLGYPLLARLLARTLGNAPRQDETTPDVTVVIAARNEAGRIAARIGNIFEQDYPREKLHVLVVSDGSCDGTETAARIDASVRVIALAENAGKAVALNAALDEVSTDFVVFTDARQRFAPDALRRLLAAFADPAVGAVSGELEIVEDFEHPAQASIGLYWRIEKSLRESEALLSWLHGVSGAVYALRTKLFRAMPAGTILDDMWVPLQVIRAGQRVWMARDAIAYDIASSDAKTEFRRKTRTLAGNWQLIVRMPWLMNPLRNPVFFAWFSHKFLRLLVPWALLGAWLASAAAGGSYRAAFGLQTLCYLAAVAALLAPRLAARVPLLPTAGTFLMLNAAAFVSLPAWLRLQHDPQRLWKKG